MTDKTTGTGALRIEHVVDGVPVGEDAAPSGARRHKSAKTQARAEAHSAVRLRPDPFLWGIYIFLILISVVELYSASASEIKSDNLYSPIISHGIFLGVGICVAYICQNLHYKYYRKWAWGIFLLSIALVVYGNLKGDMVNGAMRAINFGPFSVQPPEVAKLCMVVIVARILSRTQSRQGVKTRGVILSTIVLGIYAVMLYKNGLTNMILIVVVATAMLITGGVQWKKLLILFCLAGLVGFAVYKVKYAGKDEDTGTASEQVINVNPEVEGVDRKAVDRTGTQKKRISAWLDGVEPTDKVTDYNRQVLFARMSQGRGGFSGSGIGTSHESSRLPLAYSDYIYSIIIEDGGMIGGLFILVLYICLLARAGVIASKCTKAFPAFLITGCATLIVTQTLIHMGIVLGLLPVSGQPLPFISRGGTSILVMSMAIGMMLSVSKYAIQSSRKKQDANIELKQDADDQDDEALNPTAVTYNDDKE